MNIYKLFLTLLLTLIFSIPVYAVDFIVGAKGGYFIWKPYFEDIGGFFGAIDKGDGILYGPAVSVIFTRDISLSVSGLTGTQSTYWSLDFEQENSPDDVRAATYYLESKRYDVDSALSYTLLPYLKIFAGYKYQHISSVMRYTEARVDSSGQLDSIAHDEYEIKAISSGPGLGLGSSVIFGNGFFTTINVSGLFMQGYLKIKPEFTYNYNYEDSANNPFEYSQGESLKTDTRQLGTNIEPSVGFIPDGSRFIFTLGFRYQWMRTKFYNLSENNKNDLGTKAMHDYLYGIFVSILYVF